MAQPNPIPNALPSMHDLVISELIDFAVQMDEHNDLKDALLERKQKGLDAYGSLLQPHNGRDALQDLWEELLDAAVYARQACFEDPQSVVRNHLYRQTMRLRVETARLRR